MRRGVCGGGESGARIQTGLQFGELSVVSTDSGRLAAETGIVSKAIPQLLKRPKCWGCALAAGSRGRAETRPYKGKVLQPGRMWDRVAWELSGRE
ncbi:hypothetical protein NDU88_003484 [Pleurodeles waltl]|uniref:Uncharacterized protein n=1 Tax=Pleurodeles waltl TaxID=8319 RepID=A0AAV7TNU3_PLEWA|nr:hypothetical protein NDU88_003484 [Pleurodeles waltl]